GGAAVPGGQLDYLVHVTNNSATPVNPTAITDNLNAAGAGALTYVAGSASMNGSPNGVSVAGNVITANYSATYGPLAPGGTIDLRFQIGSASCRERGKIATNTGVVTWNTPPQTASASVSVTIGAIAGLAMTKQVSVVVGCGAGRAARLPGARDQQLRDPGKPDGDHGQPERCGGGGAHLRSWQREHERFVQRCQRRRQCHHRELLSDLRTAGTRRDDRPAL